MKLMQVVAMLAIVLATPKVMAQSVQSFTLQRGQAIRITPGGKVDVFATMQGNPSHVAEMEKKAQPIEKGMGIWVGDTASSGI